MSNNIGISTGSHKVWGGALGPITGVSDPWNLPLSRELPWSVWSL